MREHDVGYLKRYDLSRWVCRPHTLLRLVGILPLQGTATAAGLLSLVRSLINEESPRSDYQTIDGVAPHTLPREWHDLVHDHADDKQAFNRRQLG